MSETLVDRAAVAPEQAGIAGPHRFRWNFPLIAGAALFGIVVLTGLIAPFVMSGPADKLTGHASLSISGSHWFGTDEFGRDMLARSLVATRLTLLMTAAATAMSVVVGVLLGSAIWLAPPRVRETGLRLLETAVAYPGLLVALIITAIMGAGATAVVVGIGIAGIPAFARLTANLASDVSRRDFVTTARLLGVPAPRIIVRHLLPNIAEPMLILVATGFAVALVELSALSFVGLGVQSPHYDFGKLLIDALPAIYTRPSQVVGPALMIIVTILAAMLIGDGLAAAADPRAAAAGRRARSTRRRTSLAGAAVAADQAGGRPFVSVRDLRVTTTAGRELVHGVSFHIDRGEIVGLVGESGSGKSLTAMSVARLLADGLDPAATELRIGEMDLQGPVDRSELATTVALVYQDPGTTFSPALRLGTQLSEVLRAHQHLDRRTARARVVEALRTVHMTDPERRMGQHPHALSGGMRQRAMIAAALASEPALIIADEPTTALDVTVQAGILREFKRINAERHTAMLFISHDIAVVEAFCDRVIVMKDGELVEELTWQQLAEGDLRHPYTRALVRATPRLTDPFPEPS